MLSKEERRQGKKKGLTTTLPVALGKLQESGDIRRVPSNGRFDQQRYQYALWRRNPLRGFKLTQEHVHIELARRYFAWIQPASASDFQAFSGLGVKATKAALEPLQLESIEIAPEDQRFFLPGDRARFLKLSRRRRNPAMRCSGVLIRCFSLETISKAPWNPGIWNEKSWSTAA